MLAMRRNLEVADSQIVNAVRIVHDGTPRVMKLEPGQTFVFGRSDRAEVVFPESRVSRLHGMLWWHQDSWCYRDLGSANGSFVYKVREFESHEGDEDDLPVDVLREGEPRSLTEGEGILLGTRRARIEMLCESEVHHLPVALTSPAAVGSHGLSDHPTAIFSSDALLRSSSFVALRGSVRGTPGSD